MISSSRLRNSGRKWARTTSITCGSTSLDLLAVGEAGQEVAAEVRGQDDDRVGEIDGAALAVGQPAVVEHLEEDVEDVRMRLLDLVEQHDLIGPPPHRLGQHAAFLIADIARRRADQPGDAVLLHELGHVDPDHGVGIVEQEFGERLGQLGLADAGRAEEQEASPSAGSGPAGRRGRGGWRG